MPGWSVTWSGCWPKPESATPDPRLNRLDSLTGLRFVAAAMVFGFHATVIFAGTRLGPVGWDLFGAGSSTVSLFFLLSGFVLTWSQRSGEASTAFYRRRAARVLPNHFVTWLGAVALFSWTGTAIHRGPTVGSLLLVQAWVPQRSWWFAGDPVSWSLSCEIAFYALFPFIVGRLRRLGRSPRRMLAGAAVLYPLVIAVATYCIVGDRGYLWAVSYLPISRLAEFVLGIVAAIEVLDGRLPRIPLGPAAAAAAGAYLAAPHVPEPFRWVAVTLVPFVVVIVALAQRDQEGRGSVLARRWAVRLGAWSYAFYLVHVLVIDFVLHELSPRRFTSVSASAFFVGLLVASVAVSGIMFSALERPIERRFGAARASREPLTEVGPR
jgi:peptidoglycan/LPS O-acetylase OafA/YrhL